MNVSMFMFLLFGLGLVAHATLSNVVSEDMSHEMNLLSVDLTPQFKIRLVEPESLVSGAASNFTVEAKASGRLIHKEGYAVTLTLAPRSNGTCIMDMSNMVGAVQKDGIATITDVKVTLSSSAADAVCTFELQLTQISAPDTILTNTFSDIPIHNNSPPQPTPSNVFDLQIKSPNEMESGIEATIHASVTEDGHPITVEKRYTVHLSIADNSKASPACSMASSILTADVDSKGDITFPNVVLNILQNVSDVLCPLRFTLNDLNNQSDPRVAVIERSMRLIKSSVPPHTYELKIESPSEFHSGVASDMQLAVLMDGSPFPATSTSTYSLSMQVGDADTSTCSLDGAPLLQQISSGQVTFHAVTLTLLSDEPITQAFNCNLAFLILDSSAQSIVAEFVKIVNVVPAQQPAPVQYQMRIEKPYKFVSGTAVTVVIQVLIKNAPAHAADGLQVSMSFPQNGLCKFSTSNEITNAVQDDGVANLGPVVVLSNATTESVTHCDVQLSLSQTSAPTVVIEHTTVSVPFDQAQAPVYSTSISFNSDIRFNATTKISVVVRVANQVPPPESALSLKMSVEPSTAQCTLKNDPLVVSVDPKNGTGTFTDVVFEKVSSKNSAERCAPESVGCSEGETTSCTVTITILNHAAPVQTVPFTIDINPSSDPVNPSPLPPPGPDKKTRHVSYMFMIILVAVVLGGLVGIAVYLFRKRRASASMVSLNDDASYRKVRFGS